MDPLVSIIVPVYNSEQYLNMCLESIIHQSYSNYVCILIDDGSTDNSSNICKEYCRLDSRFFFIKKKNGGFRQHGIWVYKIREGNIYALWIQMIW